MTISDALGRIDALKHNTYSQEDKILWLSTVDGHVKKKIIDTHEGAEAVRFEGYGADTPLETELLVPAPYDELYLRWLEAQIDYHNGDYGKYNNAIVLYNTVFDAFRNDYNRNHMPLGRGFRYF